MYVYIYIYMYVYIYTDMFQKGLNHQPGSLLCLKYPKQCLYDDWMVSLETYQEGCCGELSRNIKHTMWAFHC